jgi:undecaprenyl phosphate N,N'-diacetylbacillosamine 1-phosphate transferase
VVESLLAKQVVASSNLVSRSTKNLTYIKKITFNILSSKKIISIMYKNYFKLIIDFMLSVFILLLISPLLLITAILIKIYDPGPIIFKQKRVGLNEKEFDIYKFRTMIVNADSVGPVLTQDNDPRITKLGKFLRRTSIDEFPQFINVLKGEMSIIGPRPEVPSIVKDYTTEQRFVFTVRPGLTGWAQINGRDELSIETKLNYDITYIKKLSFIFDLKIFLLTFPALISKRGVN